MDDLVRFNNLNAYKNINHCYTTKHNGVSNGVFTSLNKYKGNGIVAKSDIISVDGLITNECYVW
jgi:copper oxidase (laccase) domain-containing protein